jgi:SAM-dependent methyltransferase
VLSLGYRGIPLYAREFFRQFSGKREKLLDIGCGDGAFLQEAAKIGFQVFGLDLDAKAIAAAQEKRGLKEVKVMYLSDFVKEAEKHSFDAITFFEVLEHQDDPRAFMAEVKSCLRKGGVVAGSVPNRDRLFPGLHMASVLGDFPPAHFTRWSANALKRFLLGEGFVNIEIVPLGFKSPWDVSDWLSANLLDGLIRKVKRMMVGDLKRAAFSLEKLEESEAPFKVEVMKVLRVLVDSAFLPLALLMFREFKRRGLHLYFQAEYKGEGS